MLSIPSSLAAPDEVGSLGVFQLKRLWSRGLAARRGEAHNDLREKHLEHILLDALGLGLEQANQYLLQYAPTFEQFEEWVVATAGVPTPDAVARINAAVTGGELPVATRRLIAEIESMPPVLDAADLAHWDEHGYVIVHDAVPEDSRRAAVEAIYSHLGAKENEPDSWYVPNDHGIMVQYFQNPAFTANRASRRLHKAFAQLWGTADLWVTCDRVGFNVPERPGWMFRGPHMHWDVSLKQPIPFGTQGILYLTDTPPEQGALAVVPGFHRRIDAWLESLPPGRDARMEDLHALGSKPIGGRAGDMIIWHQRLPHGPTPNRGRRPRVVQYIDMRPTVIEQHEVWI
jgi:hypothetical protein